MSTKMPIARQAKDGDLPAWPVYSEWFDSDHISLELKGVPGEITMTGSLERKPGIVMLCLPAITAKQIGLVLGSWESEPSEPDSAPTARRGPLSALRVLRREQFEAQQMSLSRDRRGGISVDHRA